MTETLAARLWRLSEAGEPAVFLGRPQEPQEAAQFQRLLARGVLQHAGKLTTWDVCGACDCDLDERPIRWLEGVPVAVCPTDRGRDTRLDPEDLISFRVSIPKLAAEAAVASGFSPPVEEISPSIWRPGKMPDGRVLIMVPTRVAISQPGLVGILRLADPEGPILLLGPSLLPSQCRCLERLGIQHAVLHERAGAPTRDGVLALDLESLAPAGSVVPRLIVVKSTRGVQLNQRTCAISDQPFRLLVLLAKAVHDKRGFVDARVIDDELYRDQARPHARELRDVIRELRNALSAGLAPAEARIARDLVKNSRSPRSSYRLGLEPDEILIID